MKTEQVNMIFSFRLLLMDQNSQQPLAFLTNTIKNLIKLQETEANNSKFGDNFC